MRVYQKLVPGVYLRYCIPPLNNRVLVKKWRIRLYGAMERLLFKVKSEFDTFYIWSITRCVKGFWYELVCYRAHVGSRVSTRNINRVLTYKVDPEVRSWNASICHRITYHIYYAYVVLLSISHAMKNSQENNKLICKPQIWVTQIQLKLTLHVLLMSKKW